jgi:hypothetical protein
MVKKVRGRKFGIWKEEIEKRKEKRGKAPEIRGRRTEGRN